MAQLPHDGLPIVSTFLELAFARALQGLVQPGLKAFIRQPGFLACYSVSLPYRIMEGLPVNRPVAEAARTGIWILGLPKDTATASATGVGTPLPQIADELNVDAVAEGSVMRVGQRVRLIKQLP